MIFFQRLNFDWLFGLNSNRLSCEKKNEKNSNLISVKGNRERETVVMIITVVFLQL